MSEVKEKLLPGVGRGQKTAAQALPDAVLRGAAKASVPMGETELPFWRLSWAWLDWGAGARLRERAKDRLTPRPAWRRPSPLGHLQQTLWCSLVLDEAPSPAALFLSGNVAGVAGP